MHTEWNGPTNGEVISSRELGPDRRDELNKNRTNSSSSSSIIKILVSLSALKRGGWTETLVQMRSNDIMGFVSEM